MKSQEIDNQNDEMLPEYDFRGATIGKHAGLFQHAYTTIIYKIDGSIEERDYSFPEGVVRLDPDVQAYFPDNDSVNKALRGLIDLIPERPSSEPQH
jgi:hypothetical protein